MGIHKTITVNAQPNYEVIIGNDILDTIKVNETVNQVAIIYTSQVEKIAKKVINIFKIF